MQVQSPTGSTLEEAHTFLAKYPEVQGIDVIMTDCHGIGRGKIIRRHELEALFASGRPMPASLFGQDVAGDDVDGTGLVLHDGGGDKRCWPVPGTLGLQPHLNRGQVLVSMYEPDGQPFCADPRPVLERQIAAARALDRVLSWQYYMIPNWYLDNHRLAYRNRFAFVTTPPYTLGLNSWWIKTSEKAQ